LTVIFPLRYKLALLTSALLVTGVGTASYLIFAQSTRALEAEIEKRGRALVETLARNARDPLLLEDGLHLAQLVQSVADESGIVAARLLNTEGTVVAPEADPPQRFERLTFGGTQDRGTVLHGGRLVIASRMSFKEVDLGEAQIVMDLDAVIAPLVEQARWDVALASGALLIAGLIIAIALSQRITRPLQRLRLAANALGAGDTSARVEVKTSDELKVLAEAFNAMGSSLHEKAQIEKAFSSYVSEHVLEQIVSDPARIKLAGERREVTVMFIDIRQFTRITNWLGPERLVAFLNETFDLITARLLDQGATVDKYIGDGILAYTGAPIRSDDHARRAVAAAIAIQRSIAERNRKLEESGEEFVRLGVGIGIHTGSVVLGNIGSERKMDYTAIGEPVNVASRLQEIAPAGQILMTDDVLERLDGAIESEPLGLHKLEGLDQEFMVHQVLY
jgi:adenylate cyclase